MHKCSVDYNKSQEIKIEYSEIEYIGNLFKKTSKIQFYNPLVNEPLTKFIYYVKNAKVINTNKNKITIVLNRNECNFILSIKNLDNATNQILNENNFDSTFSIIEQKSYPPKMDIYIDNTSCIYDKNNIKIPYIEQYKSVMLYIEFDYVIISETTIKRWRLLQMKEIEPIINLTTNMFDEPTQPIIQNIQLLQQPIIQNIPPPPPLIMPPILHNVPQINIPKVNNTPSTKPAQIMFCFNELLMKKNKLKKRTEIKQEIKVETNFTDKLVLQRAKLKKKIVNDEHIIDDIIKFLDTQIKENVEYDMTIENESFFYNM